MDLHCPYCNHSMNVQGVRAGRFTPRCPNCKEKFALTIPEGDGATPRVKAILKPTADATFPLPTQTMPATANVMAASTTLPPASVRATERVRPIIAETIPPPRVEPKEQAVARSPRAEQDGHAHRRDATIPPVPQPLLPPTVLTPHPAPSVSRPALARDADDGQAPESLGGYQVLRKLGQGGMGAVYLARQLSLDRHVAVKVLSPQLAQDAAFVARFTREAFAAAQLVHHNVVQVYDIGEEKGRHFYSMEFVEGDTLAGLVHRDGKLDPETAVSYTLQAARGLKFAHDRGLIHRDVKPDNLMVNGQGIVKVADLGLVKKHGVADVAGGDSKLARAQSADLTAFNHSMGTPAYMAPEQARDAANVDHRADIYSLGCTLYDLLTGRPPFSGKTAYEVMTKHASEPITPPDVLSKRVPKEVSALLMKMVAKRPEDRYADIGQCISAMEDFLGTSSAGPFTPKEEHAAALESSVKAYRETTLAQVARYAVPVFFGVVAIVALVAVLFGDTLASRIVSVGTFVGVAVLTVLAYVVIAGATRRDPTLGKLRPLIFGARIGDWLRAILMAGFAGLLLHVFGLLWVWALVAIVAVGLAAAYHFGLQWPRDRQRQAQVDAIAEMLRTMRLRGLDEDTLRQFVCRYSGQHWEEFYEALFGYDAKLEARRRWGLGLRGKPRPKFAVWRDALIGWADARAVARKQARERRLLARTEEAKLKAEGIDLLQARKAAQKQAATLVRESETARRKTVAVRDAEARQAATVAPTPALSPAPAIARPALAPQAVVTITDEALGREHQSTFQRKGGLPALLFGTSVRYPIALALLAVFCLWFRQNNPDFPNNFGQQVKAIGDSTITELQAGKDVALQGKTPLVPVKLKATPDLKLALLPQTVRHQLSGYGVGLAGALLLLSCLVRGWKLGALALLGTAAMVVGDLLIPGLGGFSAGALSTAIGGLLFALGFAVGRE